MRGSQGLAIEVIDQWWVINLFALLVVMLSSRAAETRSTNVGSVPVF